MNIINIIESRIQSLELVNGACKTSLNPEKENIVQDNNIRISELKWVLRKVGA